MANLAADLSSKAAATHTHAETDITNLAADLAAKAAAAHTHAIADVASLQSSLNAKVGTAGNESIAGVKTSSTAGGAVITGVTDGSAAAAGKAGEVVTGSGTNVSVAADGGYHNVASVALTAGDWNVVAKIIHNGSTSVTAIAGSLDTANNGAGTIGDTQLWMPSGAAGASSVVIFKNINISAAATYYANMRATGGHRHRFGKYHRAESALTLPREAPRQPYPPRRMRQKRPGACSRPRRPGDQVTSGTVMEP